MGMEITWNKIQLINYASNQNQEASYFSSISIQIRQISSQSNTVREKNMLQYELKHDLKHRVHKTNLMKHHFHNIVYKRYICTTFKKRIDKKERKLTLQLLIHVPVVRKRNVNEYIQKKHRHRERINTMLTSWDPGAVLICSWRRLGVKRECNSVTVEVLLQLKLENPRKLGGNWSF